MSPYAIASPTHDKTMVQRLRAAGAVLVGLTTASEFGGINLTFTKLNGATANPWDATRTPGGSSGGSAAAVAGGLVTLATGGDGGGSIRIPAAFTGLPGLKTTYGRIPKGPEVFLGSMTATSGCSRGRSPTSPATSTCATASTRAIPTACRASKGGRRVSVPTTSAAGARSSARISVSPTSTPKSPRTEHAGAALARLAGLELVDVPVKLPELGLEWALAGLAEIRDDLGELYPGCADDLTPQIKFGLEMSAQLYNVEIRARIESRRTAMNEAMAEVFDQVDFVIAASNPDVAFGVKGPMPTP